jgi:hypothetical protein
MSPQKRSALVVALAGIALCAVAPVLGGAIDDPYAHLGARLAATSGNILVIAGCIFIARAKGRPWHFGLLGFLSFVGLAILWFAVADKDPSGATRPT